MNENTENTRPNLKYQPLGEVARPVRARLIEKFGEAEFARVMMSFDQHYQSRLDLVIEAIRSSDNASLVQVGVCWLAGKGYYQATLAQMLNRQFERSE